MVIMALDHVRDYFNSDAFLYAPEDLSQTNIAVFFTRFITHFCAPVFVFLAGTSAFFVSLRRTKKELSIWLIKRGLWLVILEVTIIKFAWMFQLNYSSVLLQVIWVLGISMVILAGLIHLPKKFVLTLCLIAIFGHNLFDGISFTTSGANNLWTFLHVQNLIPTSNVLWFVGYPIIPWIFLMPLGYYFGNLYLPEIKQSHRLKRLKQMGIVSIALFFILRTFNVYGNPTDWVFQDSFELTLVSYFNVAKYPPSLLYLLITLGPSVLLLAYADQWKDKLAKFLITIGRVPMFYYIIHLFVIHLLALIAAVLTGFKAEDMVIDLWVTMEPGLRGYGFSLGIVYLIWLGIIILLYPFCKWYDNYKTNNKEKWWLSYL